MSQAARDERGVVSIGDCPACSTFAPVMVLVSVQSGQLVFFCPGCETAWSSPPPAHVLDEVSSLGQVAPLGVRLPSRQELHGLGDRRLFAVDAATWTEELNRVLARIS